ncbi:hypothetical protein Bhyg_02448, partial [Pseudolycoriella hygida]
MRGRGLGRNRGGEPHIGTARRRGRPTNTNIGVNKYARPTVEFITATSSNLPSMPFLKVAEYFNLLRSPELRQAKDNISGCAKIRSVRQRSTGCYYPRLSNFNVQKGIEVLFVRIRVAGIRAI